VRHISILCRFGPLKKQPEQSEHGYTRFGAGTSPERGGTPEQTVRRINPRPAQVGMHCLGLAIGQPRLRCTAELRE